MINHNWKNSPSVQTIFFGVCEICSRRRRVGLLLYLCIILFDLGVLISSYQELGEMKRRLKGMEEEATTLRKMQVKVEKERGAIQVSFFQILLNDHSGN